LNKQKAEEENPLKGLIFDVGCLKRRLQK